MIDVSIIIPLLNRRSMITYTLESIAPERQKEVSLEILVVDNGSTDGGPDFIQQNYPYVKVLKSPQKGAPRARNLGIKHSNGPFICLLDSDDLMEPNAFNDKLAHLITNPELVAVYGPFDKFKSEGAFSDSEIIPPYLRYPLLGKPNFYTHLIHLLEGWYIPPHALLWKKDHLVQIGGQNPDLLINQDVELMFRTLSQKHKIKGINSPRALQREHSGSRIGTQRTEKTLLQMVQLRREFWSELTMDLKQKPEIRTALANFCFGNWKQYRFDFPEIAEEFWKICQLVSPDYQIPKGRTMNLLSNLTGPKKAVLIHDKLSRFRGGR